METLNESGVGNGKMARRSFLQFAGMGALAAGTLAATSCKKGTVNNKGAVDVGSGDIGILNYAYALEQLEAAFYTQVVAHMYTGATNDEISLLTDIRDHEVAHREFFKAALSSSAIITLTPNFASIDFTSRASVLGAAKAFEDLGVSAYNGAGYLIQNVNYLALAGKIVSVEARHAALIRDLITYNSFVGNDVLTISEGTSLERSKSLGQVIPVANQYIGAGLHIVAPSFGVY